MTEHRVFCVAGMHRTGTSALARVANILGASLGPDEHLLMSLPQNERGFWENTQLKELNEKVIAAFHGRWDSPPPLSGDWASSGRLESLRAEGAQVFARLLGESTLFLWKDPRNSLTLPFWRTITEVEGALVSIRHPSAVGASLKERNDIGPETASALWLRYTASALVAAPDSLIVDFDDLIEDRENVLEGIAKYLGVDAPDSAQRAQIDAFITPDLRHHESKSADPGAVEQLAIGVFDRLRSGEADEVMPLLRVIDQSGISAVALHPVHGSLQIAREELANTKARLTEHKDRLRAVAERHDRLKSTVEEQREKLKVNSSELSLQRDELKDVKAERDSLQDDVSRLEAEVVRLQKDTLALDQALEREQELKLQLGAKTDAYERLRQRRVVRLGLRVSQLARPLFRLKRGQSL